MTKINHNIKRISSALFDIRRWMSGHFDGRHLTFVGITLADAGASLPAFMLMRIFFAKSLYNVLDYVFINSYLLCSR